MNYFRYKRLEKKCRSLTNRELSEAEEEVLKNIHSGQKIDLSKCKDKRVSARIIEWFLTSPKESEKIFNNGLILHHAIFEEELNLEGLVFQYSLDFDYCTFKSGLNLSVGKIGFLSLSETQIMGKLKLISTRIGGQLNCRGATFSNPNDDAILAQNAIVEGSMLLDGCDKNPFVAHGEIYMRGIQLYGTISLRDARILNETGDAINAVNARLSGDIIFDYQSKVEGQILLQGANIGGTLDCRGATFNHPTGWALNLKRAVIGGDVLLNATIVGNKRHIFKAKGEVKLCGAQIGGQVKCRGGSFHKPEGGNFLLNPEDPSCALIGKGLKVEGPVLLDKGFYANGEVRFTNATIGGDFDASGGDFDNEDGCALNLCRIQVKSDMYLSSCSNDSARSKVLFRAKGEVNLKGAEIHGQLNCCGGHFLNEHSDFAINATGIKVHGPAFLCEGFTAKGRVDLLNANIAASLYCKGGSFYHPAGTALEAERITIGGDLNLESRKYNEECDYQYFHAIGILNFRKARIKKGLIFRGVSATSQFDLILKNASVDNLEDNLEVWPKIRNLDLSGFKYKSIAYGAPCKHDERKIWLEKHNEGKHFSPQPYRQLAETLDAMGHEKDAREIRIQMNNKLRKESKPLRKALQWWFGFLIDYGYNPFKVFKFALVIWILGGFLYYAGGKQEVIHPPDRSAWEEINGTRETYIHYPEYKPFIYSLDVFLPIVNLHQQENWRPHSTLPSDTENISREVENMDKRFYDPVKSFYGGFLIYWMYFQILAGWVLTTMLVGGLTGLIRSK